MRRLMKSRWTGWNESWKVMGRNPTPVWICIPRSRACLLRLFFRSLEGPNHRFLCRHVMLRDGLISPRSKVISALDSSKRPGSAVSTSKPLLFAQGKFSSGVSVSLRTKNGLFKDDRDTLKRRRRHRDGKLLRGGIGLTTGLGWSDRYVHAPR